FNRPICSYNSAALGSSVASFLDDGEANTAAAPSKSCFFQSVICVGCTLCCAANSPIDFRPRTASSATCALNVPSNTRRILGIVARQIGSLHDASVLHDATSLFHLFP